MNSKSSSSAVLLAALLALMTIVALVQASGYGGHMQPSYGQNYDRKVGFKTVIYHPYNAVSSRFDHRVYPAYSGYSSGGYGGYSGYSAPAPYIKTGLDYTIGDIPSNYGPATY